MTNFSWSKLMFFMMLILVLALAACGGNDETADPEPTDEPTEEPAEEDAESEEGTEEGTEEDTGEGTEEVSDGSAETQPKVTEFEPAFPEQTRAPAVVTETELNEEVVVEGLGVSWGMAEFEPNR